MDSRIKYLVIVIITIIIFYLPKNVVGQNIHYQYDDLNRLTKINYSDTLIIEYSYDELGNRLTNIIEVNAIEAFVTVDGTPPYCEGDEVNLIASGGVNYQWNTGSTQSNIIITTSGAYTVTVTNDVGLTAEISETIVVNPLPDLPQITRNGDTLVSSLASSYQWYLDETPLLGATDQLFFPIESGNYTVAITDSLGCLATSDSVLVLLETDTMNLEEIILYPNPATGKITLDLSSVEQGKIILFIYDQLGRIYYEHTLFENDDRLLTVNLSDYGFLEGIYFVGVVSRNKTQSLKFVIHNK